MKVINQSPKKTTRVRTGMADERQGTESNRRDTTGQRRLRTRTQTRRARGGEREDKQALVGGSQAVSRGIVSQRARSVRASGRGGAHDSEHGLERWRRIVMEPIGVSRILEEQTR